MSNILAKITLKGKILLPEYLYRFIEDIADYRKKGESFRAASGFAKLIDPVLVSTLFGLYKSQELPPLQEVDQKDEEKQWYDWEYDVDISAFAEKFNHLLLCLWVRRHGLPDTAEDKREYRNQLYEFFGNLLRIDGDYFMKVLIPFYLRKADTGSSDSPSFVWRLSNSDAIRIEQEQHSPEYLALEFAKEERRFEKDVIKAPEAPAKVDSTREMHNYENFLRGFVKKNLSAASPNWQKELLPSHRLGEWKRARKEREENQKVFPGAKRPSLFEVMTLGDLYEVIFYNWGKPAYFGKVFVDRKMFEGDVEFMKKHFRNPWAHSDPNPLTTLQIERFSTIKKHHAVLIKEFEYEQ